MALPSWHIILTACSTIFVCKPGKSIVTIEWLVVQASQRKEVRRGKEENMISLLVEKDPSSVRNFRSWQDKVSPKIERGWSLLDRVSIVKMVMNGLISN